MGGLEPGTGSWKWKAGSRPLPLPPPPPPGSLDGLMLAGEMEMMCEVPAPTSCPQGTTRGALVVGVASI
eukprot:scaffold67201_cov29-Tisochrysis_lutea.AAC.1